MKKLNQIELANTFQDLHKQSNMFVLPNIWNAGSAVCAQKAGFKAVGTTSAGIAYSLGYPDGEKISLEDLLYVVKTTTQRINIPLSVDFEGGYSSNVQEVKHHAKLLLAAGCVGFNIEDGLPNGTLDSEENILNKIKALVQLRNETQIPFVINARTCCYWLAMEDEKQSLNLAIKRGNLFAQNGADCVFVPGLTSENVCIELVKNINAPINIVLNPAFNDLIKLNKLGIQRLSIGSATARTIYHNLINLNQELKNQEVNTLLNHEFSYKKANYFFSI